MNVTDTVVIGAGQAGLAMSHCLAERAVDHVVLERGRVGERWRSETWDSLRLLTPNWMNGLPGCAYDGPDPDGFMSAADFVARIERYARRFDAPVARESAVESIDFDGDRYLVATADATWSGANARSGGGSADQQPR
jgi:putative flavoprotein involved in K+ transport